MFSSRRRPWRPKPPSGLLIILAWALSGQPPKPPRLSAKTNSKIFSSLSACGRLHSSSLAPVVPSGDLHHDEKSEDGPDGDRQAGEALPEKGKGEDHQVDQLRKRHLDQRKLPADEQPRVGDHQEHRNGGRHGE